MGISRILKCFDFTLHKCCFWFPQYMTYLNGTKVPLLQMSITLYHVWFTNTYTSSETMLNPQWAILFLFMKSTPFLFEGNYNFKYIITYYPAYLSTCPKAQKNTNPACLRKPAHTFFHFTNTSTLEECPCMSYKSYTADISCMRNSCCWTKCVTCNTWQKCHIRICKNTVCQQCHVTKQGAREWRNSNRFGVGQNENSKMMHINWCETGVWL